MQHTSTVNSPSLRASAVPPPARRIIRAAGATVLAFATALGLSLFAAAPALAHDKLVSYSTPGGAVQLSFNNEVLEVGAEILVTDANGTSVTDGEPEIIGPDVTQALVPDLADGAYSVDWRVVSSDGHPIQGMLVFTVVDGEISTIAPLDEEGADHDHADHDHADEGDEHADHDHAGEDHADHDHADEASSGPGVATVIAVALGAIIIVGGAIAATTIRSRRKRAAAAQTPSDTGERSQPSQD